MKSSGIIALMTVKGGSGKTTLTACLGAELAKRGHKVTLIDADPQGSLTAWHGMAWQRGADASNPAYWPQLDYTSCYRISL